MNIFKDDIQRLSTMSDPIGENTHYPWTSVLPYIEKRKKIFLSEILQLWSLNIYKEFYLLSKHNYRL